MNSFVTGLWIVLQAQLGGQDITSSLNFLTLQVNVDEYSVIMKGEVVDAGKLKFSESGNELDIIGMSGTNRGKTFKCIYKLEGDYFVVCYNMDEKGERPTDFSSSPGTRQLLVTYQKK
jgi:uncharacterized protein (TIGR03067 family)